MSPSIQKPWWAPRNINFRAQLLNVTGGRLRYKMDSTILGSHLSCIYISNKMVVLHSITKYIANIPKMNQLSYYNIILPLNSYESLLPTSNRSWHPGLIAMSDSLDHPITRGLSSISKSSTKTSKEQHVCTIVHKKKSYILKRNN